MKRPNDWGKGGVFGNDFHKGISATIAATMGSAYCCKSSQEVTPVEKQQNRASEREGARLLPSSASRRGFITRRGRDDLFDDRQNFESWLA